ncbi:hypothetical protein HUT06_41755 [Actinomadura sp. NAK00032]|uniref:hypothetical protein n=1 Tax=Actinomadura sp. NAK00032 TaxID=2742128 RepID=UPI00158FB49C|nr:hypothetical protein [Actinomadura sp. NAK00032]QKW39755.1 hypothetical protein HUT06_41755 [Actinomadura sp. NAK00032]
MSSYHEIFIRTNNSIERLVSDIATAADCRMCKLAAKDNPIAYAGQTREVAVEVELHHDFEDDYGINFSQYPIVITLRSFESDKAHEEAVARDIFENMAAIGGYAMLLTFDLQRLIAEHPSGSA